MKTFNMRVRNNVIQPIIHPWILVLLVFVTSTCVCVAQEKNFSFKHLSVENGLPHNQVTAIFQDKKGLMWFGTSNGVCSFDGYDFTVYKSDQKKSNSLSNNLVESIAELENGKMLFATIGGVDAFDPAKQQFSHYSSPSTNKKNILRDGVRLLYKTGCDSFLVGSYKGLYLWDVNKKTIAPFPSGTPLISASIMSLMRDTEGKLWIGTEFQGLYVYDPRHKSMKHYSYEAGDLVNGNIRCLQQDSRGTIWAGSNAGLLRYIPGSDSFEYYKPDNGQRKNIPNGSVNAIYKDNRGNVWMGFQYGLCLYSPASNSFSLYKPDESNQTSIAGEEVFSIYQDSKGIVWFGLYNAGLSRLNYDVSSIALFKRNINDPNSISGNSVQAFAEAPDGTLWIGIDHGGLNKYNPRTGVFKSYRHNPTDPTSIGSDAVLSIDIDKQGNVWCGTWGGGLNKLDPTKGTFSRFVPDKNKNSISSMNVWCVLVDTDGKIWAGTHALGLNLFDPRTGSFKIFTHDTLNPLSLSDNLIWSITRDSFNQKWIGTSKNLDVFNPTDSTFLHPLDVHFNKTGQNITVFNMHFDSRSRLWLATANNGLLMCDTSTNYVTQYLVSDGLPSNNIVGILEDNYANLWVSSLEGITKFNTSASSFKNFTINQGLQGNQFSRACLVLKNGKMLFGGAKGFNMFCPDSLKSNTFIPPVIFTRLEVFNQEILPGDNTGILPSSISLTDTIFLASKYSVFSIHYAALDYTSPEANQYMYMLEGFDNNWNNVKNKRSATYTNLDAGLYTFRVKASNNDGLWNDKGVALTVVILPPWYKTWWFRCIIGLVIIALYYYFARIIALTRRRKELEQKVAERTSDLQYANTLLSEHKNEIEEQNKLLSLQKEEIQQALDNLKRTQSQLVEAERMSSLGVLTAGIAHEINNPINFVFAGINSLSTNIEDLKILLAMYDSITPSTIESKLEEIKIWKEEHDYEYFIKTINKLTNSIKNGAERTANIVLALRTFSRLDEDVIKPFDINENLDVTLLMLHSQYKERIEIVRLYGSLPKIECYPGKINQVFMNILANAVQSIDNKGVVTIKTWFEKGYAKVSISDTGCGMPPEVMSRMFEPFFTTKEVGKGTGLGMSITHSIVEKHKGHIDVSSVIGQGTSFVVTIPASQ